LVSSRMDRGGERTSGGFLGPTSESNPRAVCHRKQGRVDVDSCRDCAGEDQDPGEGD